MPGPDSRRRFARGDRIVTYLTPPKLSSLPRETEPLEFSSRSLVFPNDGDRVLRVWGRAEAPWVLGVEAAGARWKITAWGADAATARRGVRDVFSLDHPLEEFYRCVRREPILRGTDRRFRGLRLPRDASVYEALIQAILGQQLSVAAANTIQGRLIEATASVVEVEGHAVPRMPAPLELEALGFDGLRRIGASGAKARSLLSLAQRRRAGAIEDAEFA
jgi:3-methyladenine DNA glycosylase/8-oxoguanine DNA glycosylase